RLVRFAVAQQVPGMLEVDDVREVAAGVARAQRLERRAGSLEASLLEQAAGGEVLVDVGEARVARLCEVAEGVRDVRVAVRVALEVVRQPGVRGRGGAQRPRSDER